MPSPEPDLSPILQALTRLAADGASAQSGQAGAGDQARFMAQGQLPLDALLDNYRRGAELLELCRSRLQAVEQQVQVLEDSQLKDWVAE